MSTSYVTDADGDRIGVNADRDGGVYLAIGGGCVYLDAAQQEEFAQLYVAACHEANANAEALARQEADGG